jgi:capsid protein
MWSDTESDTGIPLAIEVIDADRVETPPLKLSDPLCRMGVQRNAAKRIIGYWVRTTHPGDDKEFSTEYNFVPASRMKHIFKKWFAGQSRGLPWMTRVLARAKDGKDLLEAGLVANQIQNCWAVIIQAGGSPLKSAMGAASATTPVGERLEDVKPGSIIRTGSSDTITFTEPPSTNSVGTLIQHNNRTVSAGLNWPYELTHGDWRGVSHAGGRIVLHGAKLSTRMDQKQLTERWLVPVWGLFVNHAIMFGSKALGEPMAIDAARFARRPWLFTAHECTPPRWDYSLNPREEVTAKLEAIDGNLTTLEYELGEDQYDLDEVLQQREYERAEERRREILPTRSVQVEMPQGLNPDLQPDTSGDPTE